MRVPLCGIGRKDDGKTTCHQNLIGNAPAGITDRWNRNPTGPSTNDDY